MPPAALAARPAAAGKTAAPPRRHPHESGRRTVEDIAHLLRSPALNRALDVVGDWWTLCVLREAFMGVREYNEFEARLDMPPAALAQCLHLLARHGILSCNASAWRLTPRGLALYPWALMVWRWSMQWGDGAAHGQPLSLVHQDCGHGVVPLLACGGCLQEVTLAGADYEDGTVRAPAPRLAQRRRALGGRYQMPAQQAAVHIAYITADRWTYPILLALYLGCRDFDRMERMTGVSTHVLSLRLGLLLSAGFVTRERSPDDARRYLYSLTARSRDAFAVIVLLGQWAEEHMALPGEPRVTRYHRDCGARLHARVTCPHCQAEMLPRNVSFQRPSA
jgi:DNA-binding HxlR family transcriptional regulator